MDGKSDLISRKAICNWLNRMEKYGRKKDAHGYHNACAYASQMPSAEPEPQWIPCSKKHAVFPCIACDSYGQVFIPCGIVHTSDHCFDGKWFNADNLDAFFSGFDVGNGIKVLPREIIAWMPLPAPYKPKEEEECTNRL